MSYAFSCILPIKSSSSIVLYSVHCPRKKDSRIQITLDQLKTDLLCCYRYHHHHQIIIVLRVEKKNAERKKSEDDTD
jgi:hypothetical protein